MEGTISPVELSRLLSLAIYQYTENETNCKSSECSLLLAETYIKLQELKEQATCTIKDKKDPDPALLSALGTIAYYHVK